MKVWGNIRHKFSYFLKSVPEGLSPVVGSLLLLLITFALVGAVANSIDLSEGKNIQPLVAKITIESCEGGLYGGVGSKAERVRLEENQIVLMHEGGDSLPLDSISIRISGYGNSHRPAFKPGRQGSLIGTISVLYLDLSPTGKNSTCYAANNKATIEDGSWDVGERLVLCGQDSPKGTRKSSVKVSVDGDDNTSDSYGFKADTEINLKIIDRNDRNVIAERTAIVKLAD